jgi:hypothetical protein
MTGPRRLREGGTSFERELLSSARLDVASKRGMKRTLVAMGVGTFATAAGSAAGAGAAGAAVLVKWAGVGLVAAAVTAASVHYVRERDSLPRRSTPAVSAPAVAPVTPAPGSPRAVACAPPVPPLPSAQVRARPPAPTDPVPRQPSDTRRAPVVQAVTSNVERTHEPSREGPTGEENPAASRPEIARSRDTNGVAVPAVGSEAGLAPQAGISAPSSSAAPPAKLLAEIASLDGARRALAGHDARAALEELDAYDRAFPSGSLADEVTVLRVDALEQEGERARAAAAARSFLEANPHSPHAPHLRRVIAGSAIP